MRIHIGHLQLNDVKELASQFDGTEHDWCGQRVSIVDAKLIMDVEISSIDYSLNESSPVIGNINRRIVIVLTDERGMVIEKTMNIKRFRQCINDVTFGVPIGWSNGPSIVVLDEIGERLLNNFKVAVSE